MTRQPYSMQDWHREMFFYSYEDGKFYTWDKMARTIARKLLQFSGDAVVTPVSVKAWLLAKHQAERIPGGYNLLLANNPIQNLMLEYSEKHSMELPYSCIVQDVRIGEKGGLLEDRMIPENLLYFLSCVSTKDIQTNKGTVKTYTIDFDKYPESDHAEDYMFVERMLEQNHIKVVHTNTLSYVQPSSFKAFERLLDEIDTRLHKEAPRGLVMFAEKVTGQTSLTLPQLRSLREYIIS